MDEGSAKRPLSRVGLAKRFIQVVWPLMRPYVPCYDPFERRRVRRAARTLVTLRRWPGDEATSRDAAQLALLHLLELQHRVRVSSVLRQYEAAALLARTAIDTCIVGIWCLVEPGAVQRLNADAARSLTNLLVPFAKSMLLPADAIRIAVAQIGEPKGLRSPQQQLDEIQKANGPPGARILYELWYRPLSAFFAHGTGGALLRHMGVNDEITDHAHFAWARRSPAHLADVCVGFLSAVFAGPDHPNYALFSKYIDVHDGRSARLIGGIAVSHAVRTVRPKLSTVAHAFDALVELINTSQCGEWKALPEDEKVQRAARVLTTWFSVIHVHTQDAIRAFAGHLVAELASDTDGALQ